MFGRRRTEPEPPPRTAWADESKRKLDEIRSRRKAVIEALDAEERSAKALCNHTYPNGTSALKRVDWDDPYDYSSQGSGSYTTCEACGSTM